MSPPSRWMELALRLGRRALGTTAENPNVGCVIVRDERLVGLGWTQPGGRPHAETEALAMAGCEARGATAYVTLEPCAHHGRTGPCAAALVQAGIGHVVVATEDPDPRVSGGGLAILRAGGVTVAVGDGAVEARQDMSGFLSRIVRKRPYVILKLALSADDKIAARAGAETAITGPAARDRVHLLRAQCDAILVGMGTVRADDPELTCRLPGLGHLSPRPFVLGYGCLPPASHLAMRGATVLPFDYRSDGAEVLMKHLHAIAGDGINRLMVEGGARTARTFLEAGVVDEFHLYRGSLTIGSNGVDALAGLPVADALQAFTLRDEETLGADHLSVYEKTHVHRDHH